MLANSTNMIYHTAASKWPLAPGVAIADAMFREDEHGSWRETGGPSKAWGRCPPGRSSLVRWGAEGPLYIA